MTLKKYDVVIEGVETTLLLSDEDAKAQGLTTPVPEKSKTAENKSRTPANKARTTATKREEAASKAFNRPSKGNA